jgi:hypothetical protein
MGHRLRVAPRDYSSHIEETAFSHTSPQETYPPHNPNPLNNLPPMRRPTRAPPSRSRTNPRAIVELGSRKWNHRSAAPAQGAQKSPSISARKLASLFLQT